ncbi:MAG TPA: hypothetical protein VGL10_01980 [Gammaproteobacteria bacterium]
MEPAARHLIFHATVVLLVGLLCGAPYGRAILRKLPEHIVHSWRVAHLSLPLGATLMLAVSGVLSLLAVTASVKWTIAIALIVSSYAFCFSLTLAPLVGHRGLSVNGSSSAKAVYAGNILGSLASLLAAVVLLYAGFVSL